MAEQQELAVLTKFEAVLDYGHQALQQFPRHQRAHARHGDAVPAVAGVLDQAVFRRSQ